MTTADDLHAARIKDLQRVVLAGRRAQTRPASEHKHSHCGRFMGTLPHAV